MTDGMSERRDLERAACKHERVLWRKGVMLNVLRGVCRDCDEFLVKEIDDDGADKPPEKPEPPRAA